MMKKGIFLIPILLIFFLCSCNLGPVVIERLYVTPKPLPPADIAVLIENALDTLETQDDIMDPFSFIRATGDLYYGSQQYDIEYICYYDNAFGYIHRAGYAHESDFKLYFMNGYLYTTWYYHKSDTSFSCDKTKKAYNFNEDTYINRANLYWNRILTMLREKKESFYTLFVDSIKNESYYELVYDTGEEESVDPLVLQLYFNRDKEFVGGYASIQKSEQFNIGTFNLRDGILLGEEFKDVYAWMNYPYISSDDYVAAD